MLEVDELAVSYGPVRALHGVTMDAPEGSITAVLGANGAGKTTLLRAVSGLVRPEQGRVVFGGRDLRGMPVEGIVRLGMSHVPEGRGVITELTVEENLSLGAQWRRDRAWQAEGLDEVYTLFPSLADRRGRLGSTLSGGERQMLAIGRALMSRPRLLLLDEPSLGLAPRVVAQLMGILAGLRARTGLTVVLVEQNARSALSIADRVVVLNLGSVAVRGDAAELSGNERLRHAYLGF
jgi:branched-chain amino acid transport system ATP-binding protein